MAGCGKGRAAEMENIIDYVKHWGEYSLMEVPFNEVDSLVLCQLVYLHYGNFVPGLDKRNAPVSIQSIYAHPDRDTILDDYWYRENNKELFSAVAESKRFGSLKMNYYVDIINEQEQAQFSAMTYVLEDKNTYIAYRGTDATIVGWKEDLNLAFSKPLHSQHLAAEYMDRVAGYIAGCFYTGGHSKGGNLAVYAAMNCSPRTREKLIKIFNNDGPGFRPEIKAQGKYEEITDRMVKFVPRSSLVGTLLEDEEDFVVVESKGVGLLQHNAYSWKIENGAFIRARNMADGKIMRDAALNEWILSLTEEEIHAFVDTLYEVVTASEASDVFAFGADWKNCLQNIFEAAKGIDETTRKVISRIIRSFFEITGEKAALEFYERKEEFKKEVNAIRNTKKRRKKESDQHQTPDAGKET